MDKLILIGTYLRRAEGTVDEFHIHPQYQQRGKKTLNHLKKTQGNFLSEKGELT